MEILSSEVIIAIEHYGSSMLGDINTLKELDNRYQCNPWARE
jgi:hypothetical protein